MSETKKVGGVTKENQKKISDKKSQSQTKG